MTKALSYATPFYEQYSTESWDIALHGDDLERRKAEFILSKIPAYAEIWGRFIGRQPDGAAAELLVHPTVGKKFPPKDFQLLRLRYAQHQYSILASFDGMQRCLEHSLSSSPDDVLDNLILFHAYMGRVGDALERGAGTIGLGKRLDEFAWWGKIKEFYAQRSVVIHGPHLPLLFNGYEVKIVQPFDGRSGWDDHTGLWDEDAMEYTSLVDYYDNRLTELIPLAQSALANYLVQIRSMLGDRGCYLEQPEWYEITRSGRSGISGLSQESGISGGYGLGTFEGVSGTAG